MRRPLFLALGSMFLFTTLAAAQDKLPDGAALRIGVQRLRVSGAIRDHAFTPDQRTLVVAYEESEPKISNVVLFDVATGLERKRLNVRGVKRLAMAMHRPILAVDTDNGFEVWDLAIEKRVQDWAYPECVDEATALTISPDGAQVVAAIAGTLLRWNANSGEALPPFRLRSAKFPVQTLQFSNDGSKLFSAESHPRTAQLKRNMMFGPEFQLYIYEYANYYLLPFTTLAGPRTRLLHTTAWPVGAQWLLQWAEPSPIATVWDAESGKRLREFHLGDGEAAFAPDGSMVALSFTNLYSRHRTDIVRLDAERTHVGSIVQLGSAIFSPDSKRLLVDGNALWDIAERKYVHERRAHDVAAARFSPDGKLLAVVKSIGYRSPKYWSLRVQEYQLERYPEGNPPGDTLQLVDAATGKPKSYPTGYAEAVGGVAYSPDGRILASYSGETLHLHDPRTGAELRRWVGHKEPITQIAFAPDGKTLASASREGNIALWNPANGKERKRLVHGDRLHGISSFAYTGDGAAIVALDGDGDVRRWDIASGKYVKLGVVEFRGMGSRVVVADNHFAWYQANDETRQQHLQWRRIRADKLLPAFDVPSGTVQGNATASLAFSGDGKFLATGGYLQPADDKADFFVRIWESASQREIMRFNCGQNSTHLFAISPDRRLLVHGTAPPTKEKPLPDDKQRPIERDYFGLLKLNVGEYAVLIRDLENAQGGVSDERKTTRPISGHLGPINCLAFSPDGKFLATGGADSVVYIWRVEHFFQRPALPKIEGVVADYWPHLADVDTGKAYRTIARLERTPKATLTLLRKHLQPAEVAEEKVIAQQLRDLASGNFAIRQKADAALLKLGEQATPHVVEALKKPSNLEAKRRLETLLDRLDRPMDVADNLRTYRCLMLLERIGTPEARQLLEELSRGAPTAWLTDEAKHSLLRLSK